jgi:hypothetical protein
MKTARSIRFDEKDLAQAEKLGIDISRGLREALRELIARVKAGDKSVPRKD